MYKVFISQAIFLFLISLAFQQIGNATTSVAEFLKGYHSADSIDPHYDKVYSYRGESQSFIEKFKCLFQVRIGEKNIAIQARSFFARFQSKYSSTDENFPDMVYFTPFKNDEDFLKEAKRVLGRNWLNIRSFDQDLAPNLNRFYQQLGQMEKLSSHWKFLTQSPVTHVSDHPIGTYEFFDNLMENAPKKKKYFTGLTYTEPRENHRNWYQLLYNDASLKNSMKHTRPHARVKAIKEYSMKPSVRFVINSVEPTHSYLVLLSEEKNEIEIPMSCQKSNKEPTKPPTRYQRESDFFFHDPYEQS